MFEDLRKRGHFRGGKIGEGLGGSMRADQHFEGPDRPEGNDSRKVIIRVEDAFPALVLLLHVIQ